jgi:AraC-like DNA-binding protein
MEELHILIDNLVDNMRRVKGKYEAEQVKKENLDPMELKSNDSVFLERVVRCINDNIKNNKYTIEDLADDVGVSRTHLHRQIKRITGVPSSEFLKNVRLEQAASYIKEGKISVAQVAYAVGFNSQSHFSTQFKKYFGVTPKDYTEQFNKKADK